MKGEFVLSDTDSEFQEKVYVIADEVLNILKELSKENKQQINSRTIAERMVWKDNVKTALSETVSDSNDADCLREFSNLILNKFTELMPSSIAEQLSDIKDKLHNKEITGGTKEWLESPISVVRKYIDTLSIRNEELEEFMKQTMQYLGETEMHMSSEVSLNQIKFRDDRRFEDNLSNNMTLIKKDINDSGEFSGIKAQVMKRIESINNGINSKREQDMLRLKETEKTLDEMSRKMMEVKREADEIKKKSEEIEFESVRDALTGIFNRKAYDQKIIEMLAHVERYHIETCLMVCDIDFFKKVNDNFGHKAGDLALKKIASLLQERLRINDFISRYGGEEFAIILPHTDLAGAVMAAEGIRSYIDKSVFLYKGDKIPLAISVGVCCCKKDDDPTSAFERADHALYLAKRSGRNCVKTEKDLINEDTVLNQDIFQP